MSRRLKKQIGENVANVASVLNFICIQISYDTLMFPQTKDRLTHISSPMKRYQLRFKENSRSAK